MKYKEGRKTQAINSTLDWVELKLKSYNEPTKAGTPKGDPVGLSSQKYRAACLMILYPGAMKLKEIASMVGVSFGVLRVWRTQPEFKKAMAEARKSFAESILHSIKPHIRKGPAGFERIKPYVYILPYYHHSVISLFFDLLLTHENDKIAAMGLIAYLFFLREAYYISGRSFKELLKRKDIRELYRGWTKAAIKRAETPEEKEIVAEGICGLIDELAK